MDYTAGKTLHTLISQKELSEITINLAQKIYEFYKNKDNVVFVCVMNGAIFFFTDLMKQLGARGMTNVSLRYITAKSYEGDKSTGNVTITGNFGNIDGKHVVLIEDIIDTGQTLDKLIQHIWTVHAPTSVKVCCLLRKKAGEKVKVNIDLLGQDIPDKFVVGYGLDYNDHYRNLPYVGYFE